MNNISSSDFQNRPLRVRIGGPVGSGKTALVEALCKRLRDTYDIYVIHITPIIRSAGNAYVRVRMS